MKKGSLFGIILIVLGVGFILAQLKIIPDFWSLLSVWWPVILILIGAIQAIDTKTVLGPSVLILIGGAILLDNLNIINNFWNLFWPAILIIIGLSIIFERPYHRNHHGVNLSDEDVMDHVAVFSGVETANTSKNFRGGSVSAVFGGAEIDLRQAQISPEGANIDLFAAFGGITIFVPSDWKVIITGVPVFGGWDNKTFYNETSGAPVHVIRIKCVAAFGGIDIKN